MKKVLLIGYEDSKVKDFLSENSQMIFSAGNKILTLTDIEKMNPDYIVSFKCQYLLTKDIVKKYKNKIINLHGSILPYNRGAHPNVWSFLENTPKGGTIHYVDEGIDTGKILVQKEIEVFEDDTLHDTYWRIYNLLQDMFIENWDKIINGDITPIVQNETLASLHYKKDLEKVKYLLTDEWDTKIKEIL